MEKQLFTDWLTQNRLTCSFTFNNINEDNISLRLNENTASIGFLYRHIGETMLLFGNFFGTTSDVQNTTMGKPDEGQGADLETSKALIEKGYAILQKIIENTLPEEWLAPVETPFFGIVSKARLFAHILYHNSYHAGQIGLTLKRAKR